MVRKNKIIEIVITMFLSDKLNSLHVVTKHIENIKVIISINLLVLQFLELVLKILISQYWKEGHQC